MVKLGSGGYSKSFDGMMQELASFVPPNQADPFGSFTKENGAPVYTGDMGGLSSAGGSWAPLDAVNPEIASAASKYGVPPNLIKSMIMRESSGNWERDNREAWIPGRDSPMLPYVGIFASSAASHGLDYNAMKGNRGLQIEGMAKILSNLSKSYGGFENAALVYFGGEAALNGGFIDEFNMDSGTYGQKAVAGWKFLDEQAGSTFSPDPSLGPSVGVNDAGGNTVLQEVQRYLGTPYVWGAIPGKGDVPTGWDCSGFTYWMDQNYGTGNLPMGSHYQFQWAKDTGNLSMQPSPGDIVFFDTGGRAGGGAGLNAASHVGLYLGNGKMMHAANPSDGTIISDFSSYTQMYSFLGATKMAWSGGGAASVSDMGGFRQAMGPISSQPTFAPMSANPFESGWGNSGMMRSLSSGGGSLGQPMTSIWNMARRF